MRIFPVYCRQKSQFVMAGGSILGVLLFLGLCGRPLWAGQKETSGVNWSVPGTQPAMAGTVQYSANPVIPCRVVSFRSKNAALDTWGKLAVYPVVRAPTGKLYRGFVRYYEAGSIGSNEIRWTFPTQFRSQDSTATSETSSHFGDALSDDEPLTTLLPHGTYEVKWVFNHRLVNNGDHFHYEYRILNHE